MACGKILYGARLVGTIAILAALAQIGIAISQQPVPPEAGQKLALEFRSLTVQIQSDVSNGYGFVVAQVGNVLTIVTANHVVRDQTDDSLYPNINVELFVDRGHPITPRVLEAKIPNVDGDLAVLEIEYPNFSMIPFPVAKVPLPKRTKAWRVGKDRGRTPSSRPGLYEGRVKTIYLQFSDLDTPRGSSGGPVITDEGLIGMVQKDEGAVSWVLPMSTIYEFFSDNGLPWTLKGDGTSPVLNPDAPRAVLAPLVDLEFSFSMYVKCNDLDLNSFCQRAKRIFLEYKGQVEKGGGQDIKDARLLRMIPNGTILMTPLSSMWPILIGQRPPIYFLNIALFKTPVDADKYIAGDLTAYPNVSWVFAATNRVQEHNQIFLTYNIADQSVRADYSATPIGINSDGIVASFQDLPGAVMLLWSRDGQATDAVTDSLSIKDKQGRMLAFRGTEFQVKKGFDRGKEGVTFYKYMFP
jgi:hypothetical protein